MASAESSGFDNIVQRLRSMIEAQPQALKAAGVALLTQAQQSIINGGNGWPAWSPNYKPKRMHQILWDTGTLLRSLAIGDGNNVFREEGNSVTVGSNVVYAARQNFGGGGIPARPFLYVDDDRLRVCTQAYLAQLQRAVR